MWHVLSTYVIHWKGDRNREGKTKTENKTQYAQVFFPRVQKKKKSWKKNMHKKTEVWSRIEARDRENVYTLYRNIWIYIEKNLPNYIFTDFCFAKIRRGKKKSRGENVCVIIFHNLQKKICRPRSQRRQFMTDALFIFTSFRYEWIGLMRLIESVTCHSLHNENHFTDRTKKKRFSLITSNSLFHFFFFWHKTLNFVAVDVVNAYSKRNNHNKLMFLFAS